MIFFFWHFIIPVRGECWIGEERQSIEGWLMSDTLDGDRTALVIVSIFLLPGARPGLSLGKELAECRHPLHSPVFPTTTPPGGWRHGGTSPPPQIHLKPQNISTPPPLYGCPPHKESTAPT